MNKEDTRQGEERRYKTHPRYILEVGQVIVHPEPLVCVCKTAGTWFAPNGVVGPLDGKRKKKKKRYARLHYQVVSFQILCIMHSITINRHYCIFLGLHYQEDSPSTDVNNTVPHYMSVYHMSLANFTSHYALFP